MAIYTKDPLSSVTGTNLDDLILINDGTDIASGTVDGLAGIDELRLTATTPKTLTLGTNIKNVELVTVATGTGLMADTSGTAAIDVDASRLANKVSLVGNDGNNTLTGSAFADALYGGAGNDVLVGGAGADKLYGGEGNDTYVIDNVGDVVDEGISSYRHISNTATGATLSGSGKSVAFVSTDATLVAGDTNGAADVFFKDLSTGVITRVSVDAAGVQGNAVSYNPTLSADGRYVAFESLASNLVAGDSNGNADVFVKDRLTGTVTKVSALSDTAQSNGVSSGASISDNGRFVVFESTATNLAASDSNGVSDVFVKDLTTGTVTLVSASSAGALGDSFSGDGTISADGRYVAFSSNAANLVPGDTNNSIDIFVRDMQTGVLTRVSTSSTGIQANSDSSDVAISSSGRYVVFTSAASNLVAGDTNNKADVFVKDLVTGAITRVSTSSSGSEGNDDSGCGANGTSGGAAISADGRYVLFQSIASNLVKNDSNGTVDTFLKDMSTGAIAKVSSSGTVSNMTLTTDGKNLLLENKTFFTTAGTATSGVDLFIKTNPLYGGIDEVQSAVSFTLPGSVENLLLTGSGAVNGTGNDLDNVITGNVANNVLSGGTGNDTLIGGAGNDTLTGGIGNDIFQFAGSGDGVDTITDLTDGDVLRVTRAIFDTVATPGNGSIVAAGQVQAQQSAGITTLYVGMDGTPGADVTVNLNGSFTSKQFTLNGSDIQFHATPINHVPIQSGARAILSNGQEDTSYTVTLSQLLQGFSDPDADVLSVTGLDADHGAVVDNGNGSYTITPAANYNGLLTLSYTITDGDGGNVQTTLGLNLLSVNDAPVLMGARAVLADGSVAVAYTVTAAQLLQGFEDADGNTLSVAGLTSNFGPATDLGGGTYSITLPSDFSGQVTLNYNVTDGQATVTAPAILFNVTAPVNNPPVLISTPTGLPVGYEDTAYTVSALRLLEGFQDPNGDTLSITGLSSNHGVVTDNGDGTYTITPVQNYNGTVNLSYSVSDGMGGNTPTSQTFELLAVNDAPVQSAGTNIVLADGVEDTAYNLSSASLLQGFSDADSATLSVVDLRADHGTVVNNGNGSYTIAPELNYNGLVTLNYNVTDGVAKTAAIPVIFTLSAVNDAPALTGSQAALNGVEDTAYTVTVASLLQGYTDVDSSTLSVADVMVLGGHAGLVDNLNGSYTIAPDANYNGPVTLSYNITDGAGGITSARVVLNLAAVNDAPVLTGVKATLVAGTEDVVYTVTAADLLAGYSDVDGNPLSVASLSASNGTVSLVSGSGATAVYKVTPTANFNGPVTLNYFVTDGTANIAETQSYTVAAVNDAPMLTGTKATLVAGTEDVAYTVTAADLLAGYSDADGTPLSVVNLSVSNGTVAPTGSGATAGYQITPTANYNGLMTLNYDVTDGVVNVSAVQSYTLAPVNDAPVVLTGAQATLPEGTMNATGHPSVYTVNAAQLLQGYSDPDGNTLLVANLTANHGSVVDNLDGSYAITPELDYSGLVTLNYQVTDGQLSVAAQSLTFNLTATVATNDAPVVSISAIAALNAGSEDAAYTVSEAQLLAGWSDPNGDVLSVTGLTADHGVVVNNGNKTYTITHEANYNGVVSLSYSVSDPFLGNTPAHLTYVLTPVNDAPALTGAKAALAAGTEDVAYTVTAADLLAGYSDVDGNALSVTGLTANKGTVSLISGSGMTASYQITPTANYNGPVTLNYLVTDGAANVAATQSFTLTPVNDAPALTGAKATLVAGAEDVAYTVTIADLLAGYTDVDGNPLSVANMSVSNGTVAATGSGATAGYQITPTANFNGVVTINYDVTDGVASVSAVQSYTLAPVNDAPVLTGVQAVLVDGTEDVLYTVSAATLLAGFSDVDVGNTLSVANLVASNGATVSSTGSGANASFIITPAANYNGLLTLSYDVTDGTAYVATTQVFSLTPVADAPLPPAPGSQVVLPSIAEGGTIDVTDSQLLQGFTSPDSGGTTTLSVVNLSTTHSSFTKFYSGSQTVYRITPATNYNGVVQVTYTVVDNSNGLAVNASLGFNVTAVNNAPVQIDALATLPLGTADFPYYVSAAQLLQGFADPDGDQMMITSLAADKGTVQINLDQAGNPTGSFTIIPTPGYSGPVTLTYAVSDGVLTSQPVSLVYSLTTAQNGAPAVTGPLAALPNGTEDTAYVVTSGQLLQGFSDPNGDRLAVKNLTANHGSVIVNVDAATGLPDGSYTIMPAANYSGKVLLSYTVTDNQGGNVPAGLSFVLRPINDAPVLTGGQGASFVTEDHSCTVIYSELLMGFTDVDGPLLTVADLVVDNATVTYLGLGVWVINPVANYNGIVKISYNVIDGAGGVTPATYNLNVTPVNDAPALSQAQGVLTGAEDTASTVYVAELLQGFADPENDVLTVSGLMADHGQVTANADGSYTVVPAADFNGVLTLAYNVLDGKGGVTAATKLLYLDAVNDAPVLSGARAVLADGQQYIAYTVLTADLLAGFSDVDAGDALSVVNMVADHGSVVRSVDGSRYVITQPVSYSGPVNLSYTVIDGHGGAVNASLGFRLQSMDNLNYAPVVVAGVADQIIFQNVAFTLAVPAGSFVDPNAGDVVSYSATLADGSSLPAWLLFDAATQTFSGTPGTADAGVLNVMVTATDSSGLSVSDQFALAISSGVQTSGTPLVDMLNGSAGDDQVLGLDGDDQIFGLGGNDLLDGGLGADAMLGGPGDDVYVVDSLGDAVTELANEGIDRVEAGVSFTLGANIEHLALTGVAASDGYGNGLDNTLVGNGAVNTLYGYDGNDRLDGGAGSDKMYGGAGNDTYVVDHPLDSVIELAYQGVDTVYASLNNYVLGANLENVVLTGALYSKATGNELDNVMTGSVSNDTLIGGLGNDTLDGGTGEDTLDGGFGNDTYYVDNARDKILEKAGQGIDSAISKVTYTLPNEVENLTLASGTLRINAKGNAANNSLIGNAADNILDGAAGVDTMAGDLGNDLYYVDNASDVVIELQGGGFDTVISTAAMYSLSSEVENLTLSGAGVAGVGNGLANFVTGNALGNSLTGGDGDDTLDGGLGADRLTGGAGNDLYLVDNLADTVFESINEGIDLVKSKVSFTLSDNIENLTLVGTAMKGTGNALDNVITGTGGVNVLDGGAGADRMTGGLGNDIYVVDNSADVVIELAGGGVDTVQSSISYVLDAQLENLTLLGAANINATGNQLANVIIGNAGSNILDGGAGVDKMTGGAGDDVYIVDAATDAVIEQAGQGVDTVLSSVTYTLAANVENITLTGAAAINAKGNVLDNVLLGSAAANLLDGGAGSDTMAGGAGDDTYMVDNAGDRVVELAAQGLDTVKSSIDYALGDDVENLTLTGTAAVLATGNSLDNLIIGNTAANIIDGGLGQDKMQGMQGNDTYMVDNIGDLVVEAAGQGTDAVITALTYALTANVENLTLIGTDNVNGTGNNLANVITGNTGNNILTGGTGADRLLGGAGDDVYVVDNLLDVVVENPGEGNDVVRSTVSHALSANVEQLMLEGAAKINGTGNDLDNYMVGNSGDNVLDGGAGADTLIGGIGNDTYVIDNAGDMVYEVANGGTDTVKSSLTHMLAAEFENLTLVGAANIDGFGNSKNNIITGNAGNNTLDGGAGADSLVGGAGDDVYIVDATADKVTEQAGQGTDIVQSRVTYTLALNVENLILVGADAINGTGNALNNVMTGNAANNVLDGAAGADSMAGGGGNDTYVVDNAGDVVFEQSGQGIDTVRAGLSYTLGADVENLVLTGSALDGNGNALDNTLVGNGMANVLNGFAGADTMAGGAGNDTYYVDNVGDVVTELAGQGTDTVYASVSCQLAANVENLVLTGVGMIDGTGNAGLNVITGNASNNVLSGGLGNDVLIGGAGLDQFVFNTLAGSTNIDTVRDFAVGQDTVVLSAAIFTGLSGSVNQYLADTQLRVGVNITSGADLDDRLVFDTGSGSLYYDADGLGGKAGTKIALLQGTGLDQTNLHGNSFFISA